MFTNCLSPIPLLPVLLPVPVIDTLVPLPSKQRPTQLHLLQGGGLVLVHCAGPGVAELARLRDAWGFADVRVNLMQPLEGIPMVLLAAQAGELPPVLVNVTLCNVPYARAQQWLDEAAASMPATLQVVVVEPAPDFPGKGVVRCSRPLAIADQSFWRPLYRALREQLTLVDQGEASVLSVAADAMLSRAGAGAGVLAGGPVEQLLS
ncbi:hypothetical protein LRS06_21890 [Hymenobacter sp. J193]|uniref:hypothetical protein n=1 Tax=Hymenobacter sp. J193 TaxID=2898429 RepID=UPI0021517D9F|nr:hypothetical protein [Hymenobacter sp. J193]MCR5890383.1 hypothetical protein [Hymenobacter sp. J193]